MTYQKNHVLTRRSILGAGALTLTGALGAAKAGAPRFLGATPSAYGERSPLEKTARLFRSTTSVAPTGGSLTPLQDLYGIITPSSLHFERHHSGIPALDSAAHRLTLHGLVDRSLAFSMDDLRRLPSVSRVHFIECAGNAGREHRGVPGKTVQQSHGLLSCSEWTGVKLATLLQEAGVTKQARWIVAEGADAGRHARSIPLAKALDDALVVYGQNGEALRPEQGYPLRLVVPGWEGNVNVKWLHRLHVTDQPNMSRDESSSYTDLMPNGKARQFSFEMEANSVITRPSGGQRLTRSDSGSFYEISGIAWSGRGKIQRVDVSVDGGKSWKRAELQGPIHTKALTRFSLPWTWRGEETLLQSRAFDETGYVQPTREQIIAARGMSAGPDGFNHYNGIKAWKVSRDGEVTNA
jgi:sulfane dehydrogenase subunit SoxC